VGVMVVELITPVEESVLIHTMFVLFYSTSIVLLFFAYRVKDEVTKLGSNASRPVWQSAEGVDAKLQLIVSFL